MSFVTCCFTAWSKEFFLEGVKAPSISSTPALLMCCSRPGCSISTPDISLGFLLLAEASFMETSKFVLRCDCDFNFCGGSTNGSSIVEPALAAAGAHLLA